MNTENQEDSLQIFFDNRRFIITNKYLIQSVGDFKNCLKYNFESKEELTVLIRLFEENLETIQTFFLVTDNFEKARKAFFSFFKVVYAAGGIISKADGEIVMIKRNNIWDLPKGHTNKGETQEECALREVSEECGVKNLAIEKYISKTYHTYERNGIRYLKITDWYEMCLIGNEKFEPQTDEGITEVTWINKNFIKDYISQTYSSLEPIIRHFAQ